ncbi:MAG: ATP-binding region ATPase domain protein [Gemmatimonadetes bacterium]|nr:ATP-binding region ATPase domain protein [Gemmatimonadota bacterium]
MAADVTPADELQLHAAQACEMGDLLGVGVIAVNRDLKITCCNKWIERSSGRTAAELVGMQLQLAFPELRTFAIAAFERAVQGSAVLLSHGLHRHLFSFAPPSGLERFANMQQSARLVPMTDGALALIEDVTERVAREEEMRDAFSRADAANRAKANFLASMSHELRTPIGAIAGYADLIGDGLFGPVTTTQVQHLARIKSVAGHLLRIVEEILVFARVEAGREEVNLSAADANELASSAAESVEPQAIQKGLELRVSLGSVPIEMWTDQVKTRQILINLLGNAVKFTPSGAVTFSVMPLDESGRIAFLVEDTGPGIPLHEMERIFEPFTQVDSTLSRSHEGTGLGLSVSRKLARLLGGDLTVASEPGAGSRFMVTLPLISGGASKRKLSAAQVAAEV